MSNKPALTTKDGLTVYDLDPQSSELWAVAGPAGFSKSDIDPDNLPEGFRWVTVEEWQELVTVAVLLYCNTTGER